MPVHILLRGGPDRPPAARTYALRGSEGCSIKYPDPSERRPAGLDILRGPPSEKALGLRTYLTLAQTDYFFLLGFLFYHVMSQLFRSENLCTPFYFKIYFEISICIDSHRHPRSIASVF